MKKIILGLSFGLMSVLGTTSIAYADTSYMDQRATYNEVSADSQSSNAPAAYEQYGFGEVKADGQWVNDK